MALAVFPKGIVPWTDRIDLVNIVYANDPNTLAAEIGAVESTLGTMPHVETSPPVGGAITYDTVGSRIHDVQMGTQLPVCALNNTQFTVVNNGGFVVNSYSPLYDPFGMYNGSDITVKADGWYHVTLNQEYPWATSGWVHMQLLLAGNVVTADHWSWDFPENTIKGSWDRQTKTISTSWQGVIQSGQRLSVHSRNASNVSRAVVQNAYMRASFLRSVPNSARG